MTPKEQNHGLFDRACIIGIGLIGSSLARALKRDGLARELVAIDQSETACAEAIDLGIVTATSQDISAAAGCDLIIVATPVGVMPGVLQALADVAHDGAIIMDVGSVKGSVADAAAKLPPNLHVVPAHPIAGTENSGPASGFAELFENRWCILTPLARQDDAYLGAVEKVETLWRSIGSDVARMDAAHHDLALAVTSHLPHLIAYTLVGAADDVESVNEAEVVKYSAGGFRDFTRIAASDPVMWRDVFLHNKDAVLEVLGRFSEELAVMQRAIRWGDAQALEKAFTRSRGLRKAIIDAGQESAEPNFGRDSKPTRSDTDQ
ncbi:prephenate/arogenate dehydrogenase family protein [Parvularcula sp. IMCC14364]|uniref:prephenate/arogenate dehydrogenase family protein n=1 Tax=Parvularcula sp. IMCC14364 TaxID=3067902 RepID=UPI0027420433|nr:prephenate/arogenate dehydrogenase family protein [Parvularcula sp. IMCC14364]